MGYLQAMKRGQTGPSLTVAWVIGIFGLGLFGPPPFKPLWLYMAVFTIIKGVWIGGLLALVYLTEGIQSLILLLLLVACLGLLVYGIALDVWRLVKVKGR